MACPYSVSGVLPNNPLQLAGPGLPELLRVSISQVPGLLSPRVIAFAADPSGTQSKVQQAADLGHSELQGYGKPDPSMQDGWGRGWGGE